MPLAAIFPALYEMQDDAAIALTLGQKIKLNIKTTTASECLVSTGTAPTYALKNISLVRVYSKLDPIRSDLIIKSVVSIPKLSYIHW